MKCWVIQMFVEEGPVSICIINWDHQQTGINVRRLAKEIPTYVVVHTKPSFVKVIHNVEIE
jgi:hypothetical protein